MSDAASDKCVCLAIVGDMEVDREQPETVFDKVKSELASADLRFGGLEASLSTKGTPASGKIVLRHDPKMIEAYLAGGFEVVAFASNHCLDYGMEPFLETLDLLDRKRIRYVGAGRNIAEARRPAVIERKGIRVGFLSYLLLLPLGWWAHETKPGVAPVREDALYGPPYVNEEDLEAMVADIEKTKRESDVVIASYHWGSSQSRTLTLSQKAVAHAAIDAGADMVVGRHPHILQGIEAYRGKAIFYAIGNFALDHLHPMFLPTVKDSILVKCLIGDKGISRVSLRPVYLGTDGRPEFPGAGNPAGRRILDTLTKLSKQLDTSLKVEGGEAVVEVA